MPRHATRTSFKKGEGGRPKGVPNKATIEAKELALAFLTKHYWTSLEDRWRRGNVLWPEVQTLLAYGHGKPKETHELTGPGGGPLQVARIEVVIVDGKDGQD